MSFVVAALLFVAIGNAALGTAVFFANRSRTSNQAVLGFSLCAAFWALLVIRIIEAPDAAHADLLIRAASIAGLALAVSFHAICLSVGAPSSATYARVLRRAWGSWAPALPLSVLVLTRWFLVHIEMPGTGTELEVPDATYGPGFYPYILYYPIVLGAIVVHHARRMRRLSGLPRIELQFTLLGAALSVPATVLVHLAAVVMGNANQQYGPLGIVPMVTMIAYGIATRRILGVAEMIRRTTAYLVLVFLVLLLFGAVAGGLRFAVRPFPDVPLAFPYLAAALIMTFLTAPAHGVIHRVTDRLFPEGRSLDVPAIMQRAQAILQTITTTDALLRRFGELIAHATDATHCSIWQCDGNGARRLWATEP